MSKKFPKNLMFFCGALLFLASCSTFEKVRKSSDVNYKLSKANEYYDNKQYSHANELYKELMPIMKSTRNYESLSYKYAYTFFYLKDYIEASYYFRNFTQNFPASKKAEECEYMSAVCLFKYSPKYTLDQTNTKKSLEALQSYHNRYPKSEHSEEAANYIHMSQKKLEAKDADAAKLYFNISQFKAATVAYKSVLRNYPESPNADLYQFMIMKAICKYADKSVTEKQEERYTSAVAAFNELKETYPKSNYLEEAKQLFTDADKNLKKIKNEQHK